VEIIDAQVHAHEVGPGWEHMAQEAVLRSAVSAMDAVGVDAVLVDEHSQWDEGGRLVPGFDLPDGTRRFTNPFAELAVKAYPDRFGYITRIDPHDPDLAGEMSRIRSRQGRLGIRLIAGLGDPEVFFRALAGDEYMTLFTAAAEYDVPLLVLVPGHTHLLVRYASGFPGLQIVIEHFGVPFPLAGEEVVDRYGPLDQVLALAKYPNVSMKWCQVERFSGEWYPFSGAHAQLRRLLDAFGADRTMWGSDFTRSSTVFGRPPRRYPTKCTWAEAMHYLRDGDFLSSDEKALVLGGTVRRVLRWQPGGR
jgi:L-fuconolactonase